MLLLVMLAMLTVLAISMMFPRSCPAVLEPLLNAQVGENATPRPDLGLQELLLPLLLQVLLLSLLLTLLLLLLLFSITITLIPILLLLLVVVSLLLLLSSLLLSSLLRVTEQAASSSSSEDTHREILVPPRGSQGPSSEPSSASSGCSQAVSSFSSEAAYIGHARVVVHEVVVLQRLPTFILRIMCVRA